VQEIIQVIGFTIRYFHGNKSIPTCKVNYIDNQYKACFTWVVTIEFNQKISFDERMIYFIFILV